MSVSNPGSPTTKASFSPNGKYAVVIENAEPVHSDDIKISVTMRKAEPPNSVTGIPNSVIQWRNDATGLPAGALRPEDVAISDDGQFFLLAATERWTLFRKDRPPVTLGNMRISGVSPLPGRYKSLPNDLIAIDQLNNKPIVRLWSADFDQWTAFDIETNKKIEPDANTIAKWNAATREEILQKIARLRHDNMRRQLDQISPTLSQMATNVVPQVVFGEVRDIHYQFIALRRNQADRAIFEDMIKPRSSQVPPFGFANPPFPGFSYTSDLPLNAARLNAPNTGERQPVYVSMDFERSKADAFLSIFDQKASRAILDQGLVRPQFYLGRASGQVKLPFDPPPESGALRVWLAPRDKIRKNWMTIGAELMETRFKPQRPYFEPPTKEIHFLFQTVMPGQYFLKAVWDKRPAFTDREKAGPGDYESAWIGPITITAGNTTTNIVAVCTNRAPTGGETYYAADELRLRLRDQ